jgi:hypothetical protein
MDFTNINERLDLDNQMKKMAENYPKNEDDYFFFIRGKNSTEEFFMASVGENKNFGYALFNLATQNDIIKNEILFVIEALKAAGKID